MGRSRKPSARKTDSDSDEVDPSRSVVFLSSSDDEEANKDFTLEIVERAKERELKRKRAQDGGLIVVSSASSEEIEMSFDKSGGELKKMKKKKGKGKIRKKKEIEAAAASEAVDDALKEEDAVAFMKEEVAAPNEEEPVGTADSVVTEVNEVPDNMVFRKLLRGPRYFDPEDRNTGACFNCGEEGHTVADCTMERRKKPCFVCGIFGHNAKRCTQGQDCFICKRRGHIARNCPDKHNRTPQDSTICLRCGNLGHDMLSCKNDYAPDDLKEIQCYVCKNYGHLCCVEFVDNGPRDVSCFNCAQSGHTGLGCAKSRGKNHEVTDVASSTLCYKCGEGGHFARGCTKKLKFDRREGGSSTPKKFPKKTRDPSGSRSVPSDLSKRHKKKKKFEYGEYKDRWNSTCKPHNKKKKFGYEGYDDRWNSTSKPHNTKKKFEYDEFEDRWNMTNPKPRTRGGWIVDDPGDFPRRTMKATPWMSPSTTPNTRKSHKPCSSSVGHYSTPPSPYKKHGSFVGTPSSYASTYASTRGHHHHGYFTPRYYDNSQGYHGRN